MGDQTEVAFTMGFEPTVWWMKVVAVVVVPIKDRLMGRPLRRELERLRAVAEGNR
jgi:hypothetical protein